MNHFNLSDWALQHRSLVWYFMAVSAVMGAFSYANLGREEDPEFTIKTMVIGVSWPGATVEAMINEVTDRIEKKVEELPTLDYTKSLNQPGLATIYVYLKNTVKGEAVPQSWRRVRELVNDIRHEFPEGVVGPFFNDDFGDVFGNIFAFTADGLTPRQLRDFVELARAKIMFVPNVGKVNLVGAQEEKVYLEISTQRVAALGLSPQDVYSAIRAQNAITPSGVIDTDNERISIRVTGEFHSEKNLRELNLRVGDRFFRLKDVAEILRDYVDPPQSLFRYRGEPAIALNIGMKPGANLLEFGEALREQLH